VRLAAGDATWIAWYEYVRPTLQFTLAGEKVEFTLDADGTVIGRAGTNDLTISHRSISRRHARFECAEGVWRVVDLGSSNGTWVNQRKCGTSQPLEHGDEICLGQVRLRFLHPETTISTAGGTPVLSESDAHSVFHEAVDFASLAVSPDVLHLQQLLAIASRATSIVLFSRSLEQTFKEIMDLVFEHLPVHRGFIMLWDDDRENLVTRCVKHREGLGKDDAEIRFSRTIAERVLQDRVGVLVTDAMDDERFLEAVSITEMQIRSAMAAPLWRGEIVDGLIYVDTPLHTKAFNKADLDLLSALGNQLAVAVEEAKLQQSILEQQMLRQRLERYHSPAVIKLIGENPNASEGFLTEEREVSVLFADMVGFTSRCESLEPREIAELLNLYFSEMTACVFHHQGTLDKFIGDCIMAVFGAPIPTEDHAVRAVQTAIDMRQALRKVHAGLQPADRLEFRMGIHSGRVVAGDIGSERRSDYTVLGSTVNVAARLESSVARAGQIVISGATHRALGGAFRTRPLGAVRPKGTEGSIECYEVLCRTA